MSRALLASPLVAAVAGWAPIGRAAEAIKTIRFASPDLSAGPKPYAGTSTVSVAHIHGALEKAFEKDGIRIEWSFFKGAGPAVNEAFANQQVDLAFLGDLASIIGRSGGLSTRFVLGNRGSNTYLGVPLNSTITGLQDLKGKRVALFRGTADQLAFGRSLAEVNLSERDLQVVNLDWTAARSALTAGQVDAAWQSAGLLLLEARGQIKVPASTKRFTNRQVTTQAGLVSTQAFIDQHPEVLQRVVDVLVLEARWASDPAHFESLVKAYSEQGGVPDTLFRGEFANDDLRFRYSPRLDEFIATSYHDSVATAKSLGLIRREFDAKAWLAPEFVEKSLQTQKLEGLWPRCDAKGAAVKAAA